ncbi:DUF2142 domain-containing protein [Acidocella sp.]|jgi:uncharacterized membrane protein|uniref:DUF2142 domain-containing protein n=1 Tax=Acidocella sp. TaxID=50710 RepID=UPI002F4055BC
MGDNARTLDAICPEVKEVRKSAPGTNSAHARAIPWSNARIFADATGTAPYFPALYAPGALGIGVGGLIGLGPLQSLYLGRTFMLIAFLLIGAACLWFARAGQGLFFALLSLPMTLSLAASFSQDGMIIASCALAGAMLTLDETEYPKARWIAAAVIAVVIGSKPPYGLLLFITALPLATRGAMRRLVIAGLFGLPALGWVVVMMHTSFVSNLALAPYHPGPLWPGSPNVLFDAPDVGGGIRTLLHSPAFIVILPYNCLKFCYSSLEIEFIGQLGGLNAPLPPGLLAAWKVAISAAFVGMLFGRGRGARQWRALDALFALEVIIASVIAVCLSMYLSWTPVGATLIRGVQGRYMLPLVPFLPLILPRLGVLMRLPGRLERNAAEANSSATGKAWRTRLIVVGIVITQIGIPHCFACLGR